MILIDTDHASFLKYPESEQVSSRLFRTCFDPQRGAC